MTTRQDPFNLRLVQCTFCGHAWKKQWRSTSTRCPKCNHCVMCGRVHYKRGCST